MMGCQPSPEPPVALWIHPSQAGPEPGSPAPRMRFAMGVSLSSITQHFTPAQGAAGPTAAAEEHRGGPTPGPPPAGAAPQEEKQSPQHSMQISRQSADSQQASMMPQSMSQGRSQSAHSPELQQQQQMQESSEVQEPHVAQSSTMLQRVRNSQKRQERMQWTQQSSCASIGM